MEEKNSKEKTPHTSSANNDERSNNVRGAGSGGGGGGSEGAAPAPSQKPQQSQSQSQSQPQPHSHSQRCAHCRRKFGLFLKRKQCGRCEQKNYCKACLVPTTLLTLPDGSRLTKQRMCRPCNLAVKIPRLIKLRKLLNSAINAGGSYPLTFPVDTADGWHKMYWIIHSELRKIQRFNNDVESLNIFDPAAPTWSSCIDEIYSLSNQSASLSVMQLKNQIYVQKMYLLQTDSVAYLKIAECIAKFQNAAPGERRQVLRYLMQIIFSKMKSLLLGLLQHEVAFRIRLALPGETRLADFFLQWFIFGDRKVLQSLLQLFLHAKHDPLGFTAWLHTFGRTPAEAEITLNELATGYHVFSCAKRPEREQPRPRPPLSAKLKREIEAKTKSMGDTVNGHKDLLSVLFALMRDRIREGKAGRRIKNISNFIKGFLLAANGADLEDGERQRDKVQFHDMKQYTSRADSSLLFYTRCAVAVYGPLLLNSVFYKHYPPANISAAKGQGTPVQYNLIFQHTGIHRHQIIHAQWGAYDFNPPHFVAVVPHRREVLVAIRGSMNLRDAITDVMAAELPFPGSPNSLTHAGFLLAARVKLSILGPLLADVMRRNLSLRRVVIVGHSLGAAITTLLALLLKRRYPQISVAAYAIASPPVLSMPLARDILEEVDVRSYVFRHDLVPRLCLASLDMLKERVSKALGSGKELIAQILDKKKRERKLDKKRRAADKKLMSKELNEIDQADRKGVKHSDDDDDNDGDDGNRADEDDDDEEVEVDEMEFSDIVNDDDGMFDGDSATSDDDDGGRNTPTSDNRLPKHRRGLKSRSDSSSSGSLGSKHEDKVEQVRLQSSTKLGSASHLKLRTHMSADGGASTISAKKMQRRASHNGSFLQKNTPESRLWIAAARGQEWNVSRELRRGAHIINLPDQFAMMMTESAAQHEEERGRLFASRADASLETNALHQAISSTLLFSQERWSANDDRSSGVSGLESNTDGEDSPGVATSPKNTGGGRHRSPSHSFGMIGKKQFGFKRRSSVDQPTTSEINTCSILALLLDAFPESVSFPDQSGHQPIHYAARLGLKVVVRFLLERKADPNACPPAETIQDGSRRGGIGSSSLYTPLRASPNKVGGGVGHRRYTPLHYAVLKQDSFVVALLLAYKADPEVTDHDPRRPQSARALAKVQRDQTMYHILSGDSNDVLDAVLARARHHPVISTTRLPTAHEVDDNNIVMEHAGDSASSDGGSELHSQLEPSSTGNSKTNVKDQSDDDKSSDVDEELVSSMLERIHVASPTTTSRSSASEPRTEVAGAGKDDAAVAPHLEDVLSRTQIESSPDRAKAVPAPAIGRMYSDGTPVDLIREMDDTERILSSASDSEDALEAAGLAGRPSPRRNPDGRRGRRTTATVAEKKRVFLYVAGRCFRIVSHEELRKWKSDDQIAAENTRSVEHTGISTTLVDNRSANTFLNLRTLFDEPTAPASSMPDVLSAQRSNTNSSALPRINRSSMSAPAPGVEGAIGSSTNGDSSKSLTASSSSRPVENSTTHALANEESARVPWLRNRNAKGAYVGEGADHGRIGIDPNRSSCVSTTGGGGRQCSASESAVSRIRQPSEKKRRPIGRFTSLHQSSAPSFHHVDVGLGGGYLVEVSRQHNPEKMVDEDGREIEEDYGWLRGIKLSRHMFSDHMPNRYEKRIQDCSRPQVEASGWVRMSTAFGSKGSYGTKKHRYLTMTHEHAMDFDKSKESQRRDSFRQNKNSSTTAANGHEGSAATSSAATTLSKMRIRRRHSQKHKRRQCAVLRAYKTDQWFRRPNFATKDCLCLFLSGFAEKKRGYLSSERRASQLDIFSAASMQLPTTSPMPGDGGSGHAAAIATSSNGTRPGTKATEESSANDPANEQHSSGPQFEPLDNGLVRVTQPRPGVLRVVQSLEAWLLSNEVAYDGQNRRFAGLFEQKKYTGFELEEGQSEPRPESSTEKNGSAPASASASASAGAGKPSSSSDSLAAGDGKELLPFEMARHIVHCLELRTLKEWQRFLFSKTSETWFKMLESKTNNNNNNNNNSSSSSSNRNRAGSSVASEKAGGSRRPSSVGTTSAVVGDDLSNEVSNNFDHEEIDWDLQVSIFKIPCRPDRAYAQTGWSGWADWLCHNKHAEVDVITTDIEFVSPEPPSSSQQKRGELVDAQTPFEDWCAFIAESMVGNLNPVEEHA